MAATSEGTRATSATGVYYRFTDAEGRVHIVDTWSEVPEAMRARSERIELAPREAAPVPLALPSRVDWPSFGVGFATAMVAGALLLVVRRRLGLFTKIALAAAAAVLLGGLYLGLLRRATGQSGDLVGTPSALMDDARRAAERVQQRNREQEELLRQIEREAK